MTATPPYDLPAQLTSFIGREKELAELKPLLSSTRLLTLTGSGGVGKTRLALQLAAAVLDQFEDGVIFVALAELRDPALLLRTIAVAFDLGDQPHIPVDILLHDYVRDKHLLLVLDNFEQLIAGVAQLSRLIAAAPRISALVTSRELLAIYGEVGYAVPPLALPDPKQWHGADQLAQCEAVALFVERARAARLDFTLRDDNAAAVAEICLRLDGLPLAIELAATRARLLAPSQLLAQLGDRLKFLTGGARDRPTRQQTLRGALDWSHQLLAGDEQTLFRRLAVFVGGSTLEAVEAVCDLDGTLDVLSLLQSLVDKSLVKPAPVETQSRFVMLETVREYAHERLAASGELETMRDRHFACFLGLALAAERGIQGAGQRGWRDRLQADYANLIAALHWSVEHGHAEAGLRLAGALTDFWSVGGHVAEGRAWFDRFLALPETSGRPPLRAQALWGAGRHAVYLGDAGAANAQLQESAQIWRALGNEAGLARALRDLGFGLQVAGDFAAAQPLLEESAGLFRKIGDRFGLAYALRFLGNSPDVAYATRCLEEGLALFRVLQYATGIGAVLFGLGSRAIEQGNFSRAKDFLAESLSLRASVDEEFGVAVASGALGDVALLEGELAQAMSCYDRALAIHEKHAHRMHAAAMLNRLSLAAILEGEHARALPPLQRSLSLNRELANKPGLLENVSSAACWAAGAGQSESAVTLFGAADGLLLSTRLRLPPAQRMAHDRHLNGIRSRVKAGTFAQAWAEGQRLTLEQAIAAALQVAQQEPPTRAPRPAYPAGLTAREVEVLRLLVRGLTNTEIAEQLVVSPRTVNAHLNSIYGKLDVTTRTAAARVAGELKLV